MPGVHAYEDFYASHDHMPGKGGSMRVTGTVLFVTSGYSCDLTETQGNTGINPQMLSLDLHLKSPPEGAIVQEVITPCPVEWSVDDPEIEYQQVTFVVVGDTGDEAPPIIDVDHPEQS